MSLETNVPSDYSTTLQFLKTRINLARYKSLRAINTELINLYWDIGKLVSEKSANGWGTKVVDKLSLNLQLEFQGVNGFSRSNLFRMKQFYETYMDDLIVARIVRQLP